MTLKVQYTQKELQDLFVKHGFKSHHTEEKYLKGDGHVIITHEEKGQKRNLIQFTIKEEEYPKQFASLIKISQNIMELKRQKEDEEEKELRRRQYFELKKEFGKED